MSQVVVVTMPSLLEAKKIAQWMHQSGVSHVTVDRAGNEWGIYAPASSLTAARTAFKKVIAANNPPGVYIVMAQETRTSPPIQVHGAFSRMSDAVTLANDLVDNRGAFRAAVLDSRTRTTRFLAYGHRATRTVGKKTVVGNPQLYEVFFYCGGEHWSSGPFKSKNEAMQYGKRYLSGWRGPKIRFKIQSYKSWAKKGVIPPRGYGRPNPRSRRNSSTKGAYPFNEKQEQYSKYTPAQLLHAQRDANEAAQYMKGHDTAAEKWYMDDFFTITDEINRRRHMKNPRSCKNPTISDPGGMGEKPRRFTSRGGAFIRSTGERRGVPVEIEGWDHGKPLGTFVGTHAIAHDLSTPYPKSGYYPGFGMHGGPADPTATPRVCTNPSCKNPRHRHNPVIIGKTGRWRPFEVIQRSANLRGIREYVGKNLVKVISIKKLPSGSTAGDALLQIDFANGSHYSTGFADWTVLKNFLRNWRNVYGAPLIVNGERAGVVSYSNAALSPSSSGTNPKHRSNTGKKRKYHFHVKGGYIGSATATLAEVKGRFPHSEIDTAGRVDIYSIPAKRKAPKHDDNPKQVHRQIVSAFLAGRPARAGGQRYKTDGQSLWVWGNLVAQKVSGGLKIRDAGWRTLLTKNVLNEVLNQFGTGMGIYQQAHQWYLSTPSGKIEWAGEHLIPPYGYTVPPGSKYETASETNRGRKNPSRGHRRNQGNQFEVEMIAWGGGKIRIVTVPQEDIARAKTTSDILELVFKWGQNDFQPQRIRSVSVGDVVRYGGKRYRVEVTGFRDATLPPDTFTSMLMKGGGKNPLTRSEARGISGSLSMKRKMGVRHPEMMFQRAGGAASVLHHIKGKQAKRLHAKAWKIQDEIHARQTAKPNPLRMLLGKKGAKSATRYS